MYWYICTFIELIRFITIPEPHLFMSDLHLSLSRIPYRCHSLDFFLSFIPKLCRILFKKDGWLLYFLILGIFLLSCGKYLLEMFSAARTVVGTGNTVINDIHNPYLREYTSAKICLLPPNVIGIFSGYIIQRSQYLPSKLLQLLLPYIWHLVRK